MAAVALESNGPQVGDLIGTCAHPLAADNAEFWHKFDSLEQARTGVKWGIPCPNRKKQFEDATLISYPADCRWQWGIDD